jgi:hypothetical protein
MIKLLSCMKNKLKPHKWLLPVKFPFYLSVLCSFCIGLSSYDHSPRKREEDGWLKNIHGKYKIIDIQRYNLKKLTKSQNIADYRLIIKAGKRTKRNEKGRRRD